MRTHYDPIGRRRWFRVGRWEVGVKAGRWFFDRAYHPNLGLLGRIGWQWYSQAHILKTAAPGTWFPTPNAD